jgi:hypothetical protein
MGPVAPRTTVPNDKDWLAAPDARRAKGAPKMGSFGKSGRSLLPGKLLRWAHFCETKTFFGSCRRSWAQMVSGDVLIGLDGRLMQLAFCSLNPN